MAASDQSDKPRPDVDKKTAKGKGEGGFAPHPETDKTDKPAAFDPNYRANVEPPPVKPVGKKQQ